MSGQDVHAVPFAQLADSVREALHHGALPLLEAGHVHLDRACLDPSFGGPFDRVDEVRSVDKRLTRDASVVQAFASESVPFDEEDALAELRRANGSGIAARTRPDDEDVDLADHRRAKGRAAHILFASAAPARGVDGRPALEHYSRPTNRRAGCSREFRTFWTKAAPTWPSITRWSNEHDRYIISRIATWSCRTTGRFSIWWTPRMATSGQLMIGVARMPPSLPSDVIVKVEPWTSCRDSFLSRAAPASRSISFARSHSPFFSASCTTVTVRPSSVAVAMPML